MNNWSISVSQATLEKFSTENHRLVVINELMPNPETAIQFASLQKFAKITPQYPGVRAPLPEEVTLAWAQQLSPVLDKTFGETSFGWQMQAWFSLVTTPPEQLIPLQCFPHVDGTNPEQLAMMLYLHDTDHGGTGFFRHKSSGLEALTDATFPAYRSALEADVNEQGLPKPAYVSDGEPLFERIYEVEGAFNQAVFYRGNLLHSGMINNAGPFSADPIEGRLTINAFFRPKEDEG